MPQEKAEQRRLIKLHPHLEGKKVLFIESYGVISNPVWRNRCRLERMKVEGMEHLPRGESGTAISLSEYMRVKSFDALIIHPVAEAIWIQRLVEVLEQDNPVVIIEGGSVYEETEDIFRWFRDLHIPIVDKRLVSELYESLLDALDSQFAIRGQQSSG